MCTCIHKHLNNFLLNTFRLSDPNCFLCYFSNSSCGSRATLQIWLFLICGRRRSSPVSVYSLVVFCMRCDTFISSGYVITELKCLHSAFPCSLHSAPIGQAVHQLLLIQAFRPDRLLAMSHIFVSKVLGETFMNIIEQPLDLANIVDSEVVTNIALIFLSPRASATVSVC